MKEELKAISIKGRFAYSVSCLEAFLEKTGVTDDDLIQKLVELMWEYPTSNRLDVWDDKIDSFIPEYVLDNDLDQPDYLSNEEIKGLHQLYTKLPNDLVEVIGFAIDVGRCNLYGGTGEFSECTLTGVLDIIEKLKLNQVNLPDLELYRKFTFSEKSGWGVF